MERWELGEDSLAKNTAIYLEILADRIRRSHSEVPFELVERSISADPELHSGEWIAVERALGGHPKPAIGGHLKSGQRDS